MKKSLIKILAIFLFLGLTSIPGFTQTQISEDFLGEWEGTGSLMGNEATFEMTWEYVLGGQFLKLTFENRFNNGSFSMQAHGYYSSNPDGTFSGYWFDSRGASFPLKGGFTSNSITTEWEDPGVEKGKTEYKIVEPGTIEVTDFVLKEGLYVKFAEAKYQRKK